MFRPLVRSHRRPPRRGTAILITCFFLITIMMVTGLALVMYAAREKAAALAYQDGAAVTGRSLPDPTNTVNQFLGTLIYDEGNGDLPNGTAVDPNSRALQNALRGHSIARSMYGSRSDYSNPGTPWIGSTVPWNGVGTFHEQGDTYGNTALNGVDRARMVNHTLQVLRENPADPNTGKPVLLDPEWTGVRAVPAGGAVPTFATGVTNRNYVSKAAGYTYPDVKNFWLGARDPATGEVLVQSFHRDWLFGGLAPNNANWTNEAGKLLTLRPRPQEHPLFPRVQPNADGSYTGDVQNLPGSYSYVPPPTGSPPGTPGRFISKNDSLWMHIGLPPITLSDGRRVQPLVAPLILPLDGSFDLSHHGSEFNAVTNPPVPPSTTPTTTYTHLSHGGLAAWEINIGKGTAADLDAYNLLAQRKNAPSRGASEFNPYVNAQLPAAGQQQLLPRYAPVSWSGALVNFKLPSEQTATDNALMLGLPSSGNPSFSGGAYGNFQSDNGQISNHPAGYNSNDFGPRNNTTNLSSPVYPWTDLKRLMLRHTHYPDWYSQAFVTKTAATTFQGEPTKYLYYANPTATGPIPPAGFFPYRTDPAHARRGLFVPRTMSLDRPALSPTFLSRDGANALQVPAPAAPMTLPPYYSLTSLASKPDVLVPAGTAFPAPTNPGPGSDFASPLTVGTGTTQQWYNALARLGSVNLNRPLADYRVDVTKPLIILPLTDPTKPFTDPANAMNVNVTAASAAVADADRQALAKDIFARLIVATGAAAYVDPNSGAVTLPDPNSYVLTTPTTPPQTVNYTVTHYNALRYLAQVAVNIVDYIDNDDISTTFQWNSTNPNDLPGSLATDLTQAPGRVVFGVEKPRLALNEMYGEITNDPVDKEEEPDPMNAGQKLPLTGAKAHVRFWAELVNPTDAPHNPPAVVAPAVPLQGIFGDGSVPLSAYQIQISRANRKFLPNNPAPAGAAAPVVGNTSSYLTNNNTATPAAPLEPRSAENVLGVFDPLRGRPDSTFTMSAVPTLVKPNGGQYAPPLTTPLPDNGIVLLRTNPLKAGSTGMVKPNEFNPTVAPNTVWANAITSPAPDELNSLGYTIDMPKNKELANAEFRQHVVLLQRLANPYLPSGATNPYVTVDMMDYVPAFDAVNRADTDKDKRKSRPATAPANDGTEFDPVGETTTTLNRFSVGKVQPLASFSSAVVYDQTTTYSPGTYNQYTFAATATAQGSMVLNQTTAGAAGEPMHTFGRHNGTGATQPPGATVTLTSGATATLGTQTIMLPFDWQIHMDRPLETIGDVFFSRDAKPYMLTQTFVVNKATGLDYSLGSARWLYHSDGLARALELLTVKSPKLGDAHGGRVGGKVNPNVVQDSRIAQGVWDPQASNRFDINFVTNTVWGVAGSGTGWMNSRSPIQPKTQADGTTAYPVPVPSSSVLDLITGGVDRPFLPYGAPSVPAGASAPQFAYTAPNTTNDGDTFLRRPLPTTTPVANPNPEPYLVLDPVADTNVNRHPYTQTDPLRKVMNNLTPVSHTFVVYFTIGYFEVSTPAAPANWPSNVPVPPQFGAEVYDQIPGDMRQRYIAVIDMSNMALKASPPANDADPHATVQPFSTALAGTTRPVMDTTQTPPVPDPTKPVVLTLGSGGGNGTTFTLATDGQTASINVNDVLVLGYGVETQIVTVNAVGSSMGPLAANQISVTGLTRTAWGGTCVSNVRPGYAGPRTDFNFLLDKYKPVVPYVERLR